MYPLAAAVYGTNLELVKYVEKRLNDPAEEHWLKVDFRLAHEKIDGQMPMKIDEVTYKSLGDWYIKHSEGFQWTVKYDASCLEVDKCKLWQESDWYKRGTLVNKMAKKLEMQVEKSESEETRRLKLKSAKKGLGKVALGAGLFTVNTVCLAAAVVTLPTLVGPLTLWRVAGEFNGWEEEKNENLDDWDMQKKSVYDGSWGAEGQQVESMLVSASSKTHQYVINTICDQLNELRNFVNAKCQKSFNLGKF